MPWCPKCKIEYPAGIRICADCGCELTDKESNKDQEPVKAPSTLYVDSRNRAHESRSSAWVLLVMGGLGLIAMILGIWGVLPLGYEDYYFFYSMMSVVFLLLIVMGAFSMKDANFFAMKAKSENTLGDAILRWCRASMDAAEIDREAGVDDDPETPDGVLYFGRTEVIKARINHQFLNLDQSFLDHFIDDKVYDVVFGEKEA